MIFHRYPLRIAGWESLELMLQAAGGMKASQIARTRKTSQKSAFDTLRRSRAWGLVQCPKPGLYMLTDEGRAAVLSWIDAGRILGPRQGSRQLPRTGPIIEQAVRTQPTSVFDLARVMKR